MRNTIRSTGKPASNKVKTAKAMGPACLKKSHEKLCINKAKTARTMRGTYLKERAATSRFREIVHIGIERRCDSHVWPLETEEDYLKAVDIVEKLAIKGEEQLTKTERDQLEIFSILLERYEDDHYPIHSIQFSPIELIQILMRESGMNASDLGRLLGDRPLGYRILNGERELSKAHIKILSEHFKIDAGAFL
jgi:HTH-type transcriptional regulator / antitoxin HigA